MGIHEGLPSGDEVDRETLRKAWGSDVIIPDEKIARILKKVDQSTKERQMKEARGEAVITHNNEPITDTHILYLHD